MFKGAAGQLQCARPAGRLLPMIAPSSNIDCARSPLLQRKGSLTSRPLVVLVGLEAGVETAAEASLAASLSNLADRNKMGGQNELDVKKCENRNLKNTSKLGKRVE